jgi:hypothetical protein
MTLSGFCSTRFTRGERKAIGHRCHGGVITPAPAGGKADIVLQCQVGDTGEEWSTKGTEELKHKRHKKKRDSRIRDWLPSEHASIVVFVPFVTEFCAFGAPFVRRFGCRQPCMRHAQSAPPGQESGEYRLQCQVGDTGEEWYTKGTEELKHKRHKNSVMAGFTIRYPPSARRSWFLCLM